MKFCLSSLLSFFSLIFLSACGNPTTSRVELSSKLSFLSADHEIIFLGRHYLSNTRFSLNVESDGFDIELLQGKWEFALIAWEKNGSGRFTGTTRCGVKENTDVQGASAKLDFDISTANCNNDFFRRPGYLSSVDGQLQNFKLRACGSLSSIISAGSTCTPPPTFSYFRIGIIRDDGGIKTTAISPPFFSECYQFGSTTALKFPAFSKIGLHMEIKAYVDSSCTNYVKSFHLTKGIEDVPGLLRSFDSTDTTVSIIGNETPAIIAKNTIQLSLGSTVPPLGTRTASLSFIQPNHYSGTKASSCAVVMTPAFTTINNCTCSGTGVCTLSFTLNNSGGGSIDKLTFQYTLTDASLNVSNTAVAISCSGSNNSCTF